MRKKIIKTLVMTALILAISVGFKVRAQATTDLAKPSQLNAYNPKPNVIYLKWNKISGADGYYVYYSTSKSSGYKILNVEKKNAVVLTGFKERTNYYFKVKSYNSIGVVSEISDTVSCRSSTFGIDVSYHNGDIDWAKVKPQIDFAILRVGYGNDMASQDDTKWSYNAGECARLGIPYGAYIYSYATNVAEAISEANHAVRLVRGHNLTYPVYYDMEDANTTGLVSAQVKGDLAQNFCNIVQSAGYKVGIYANTNWFTNHLTDSRFSAWEKWVAQYNTECTYNGEYKMWQYSSDGSIDGIQGRVDVNYKLTGTNQNLSGKDWKDVRTAVSLPAPKNLKTQAISNTGAYVKWDSVAGATRYIVYRKKEGDKKFARVAVTIGTEFYDTNLAGRSLYFYKVCAYTGDDKVAYFSQFSSTVKAQLYIDTPADFKAVQHTKNSIKLTWSKVSGVNAYSIYRYDSSKKKYVRIARTKTNSYIDSYNVSTGVTYKYRLDAEKKVSEGKLYSKVQASKTGIAGPAKVASFTADNSKSGVIKLKWNKTTGASRYELYYSTSKHGTYHKLYTASSGKLTYDVKNLKKGKVYYFKMRAVRSTGGITIKSSMTGVIGKTFR